MYYIKSQCEVEMNQLISMHAFYPYNVTLVMPNVLIPIIPGFKLPLDLLDNTNFVQIAYIICKSRICLVLKKLIWVLLE